MYRETEGHPGKRMTFTDLLATIELLCNPCLIPDDLNQLRISKEKRELVQALLIGMNDPDAFAEIRKVIESIFEFRINRAMSFIKILYALKQNFEWHDIYGNRFSTKNSDFLLYATRTGLHGQKMVGFEDDFLGNYSLKIELTPNRCWPDRVNVLVNLKIDPIPEKDRQPNGCYLERSESTTYHLTLSAEGLWRLLSAQDPSGLDFELLNY